MRKVSKDLAIKAQTRTVQDNDSHVFSMHFAKIIPGPYASFRLK
jgi:hypothetical protein